MRGSQEAGGNAEAMTFNAPMSKTDQMDVAPKFTKRMK